MKKLLLWIGIIVLVVALALLAYYLWGTSTASTPTPEETPEFPIGGSVFPTPGGTSSEISVINYAGENLSTKDFINNGETVADIENPGSYVLAGSVGYCLSDGTCPSGAPTLDFSLTYNKNTNFFNLVLLKEPLGTTRLAAEQFLQSQLGISKDQMCVLRYFVGTPYWINEHYDDRNLGFSFCPGATALP